MAFSKTKEKIESEVYDEFFGDSDLKMTEVLYQVLKLTSSDNLLDRDIPKI